MASVLEFFKHRDYEGQRHKSGIGDVIPIIGNETCHALNRELDGSTISSAASNRDLDSTG